MAVKHNIQARAQMGAKKKTFIFCVAALLGTQDVWITSNWKVFVFILKKQPLTCTLVSNGRDTHSVDLDNSEMIASPLVFSVYVKIYGLLKCELARVS